METMEPAPRRQNHGCMRFALGNGVRESRNFVVGPDTTGLVNRLAAGGYVLLTGPRRTGKTSTVFFAFDKLRNAGFNCIYLNFPSQCCEASDLKEFWMTMSWCIHQYSDGVLPAPTEMPLSEGIFGSMFEGDREDIILVFDEANHFSKLPTEFKDSFLNNVVWFLKQIKRSRLLSLMMVGTDSLLADLKVGNKYLNQPLTGSDNVTSPFSNYALFSSENFTEEQVFDLIAYYSIYSEVHVDNGIPESIFNLTRGYKGLVGVCCSLLAHHVMMGNSLRKSCSMWHRFVKSSLVADVFARPVYKNICENCHALGDKEWILFEMLKKGGRMHISLSDPGVAAAMQFMVAEGIALDTSYSSQLALLEFSSPLLHSCLLRQICLKEDVDVPSGPMPFSRIWMLERTIELLNVDMLRKESLSTGGYTCEYEVQFEFYMKLKKVLTSHLSLEIIPEAKYSENFRKIRLDLLVRGGDTDDRWSFELLRQATSAMLQEHYKRAVSYAGMHDCHIFMVNFVLDGANVKFTSTPGAPVTVFNVVIDGSQARMLGSQYEDGGKWLHITGANSEISWE